MKTATTKPSRAPNKRRLSREKAGPPRFWIRRANRELDRTGDFILKNLIPIRKEARVRAGPA